MLSFNLNSGKAFVWVVLPGMFLNVCSMYLPSLLFEVKLKLEQKPYTETVVISCPLEYEKLTGTNFSKK
jgi:hypothetical protein